MLIGIDLGTTYSCVSYINQDGIPDVIKTKEGSLTTPSVVWYNGSRAFVGKLANDRRITPNSPIFDYIKRDIGMSREDLMDRYFVGDFFYGPMGFSAIILKKLKKEAFLFFKRKGYFDENVTEKTAKIEAVITVPAYFGDRQRQETRAAGEIAGLDVAAIINEPTAAALAYGRQLTENKRILVFDLGGGTFDVTILKVQNGEGIVLASDGADKLGGKDWDDIIIGYIYNKYYLITGNEIPEDMGWEIQQMAVDAKIALSESDSYTVFIPKDDGEVKIELFRSCSNDDIIDMDANLDIEDLPFYFEERSSELLSLCQTICERVLSKASLTWNAIDDVVMAGGSCRMPMIPKMLEKMTHKRIQRNIPGFNYDTAISIGATLYGSRSARMIDVVSKTIGIEILLNGNPYIEHLIQKNTPLPATYSQSFPAQPNAILKVFEGDEHRPDECVLRGRLDLENPRCNVTVSMVIDDDGVLSSRVEYSPNISKELKIQTDNTDIDINQLKERVDKINVTL